MPTSKCYGQWRKRLSNHDKQVKRKKKQVCRTKYKLYEETLNEPKQHTQKYKQWKVLVFTLKIKIIPRNAELPS